MHLIILILPLSSGTAYLIEVFFLLVCFYSWSIQKLISFHAQPFIDYYVDSFMIFYMQALHEALMRQEELLAYIDRQEEAKFRVG